MKSIMSKDIITLNVSETDSKKRLDIYLAEKFPNYSRSFFKRLIEEKEVKINNITIEKPSFKIKSGEIITFSFPKVTLINLPIGNEDIGAKILYEHPDFLIVYKPAGLIVHRPTQKSMQITLVDWLIHHFKDLKNVGYQDRPGIVHRLDKDTSGILIVPRNNCSHTQFAKMFKSRTIEKTYFAIVKGHTSKEGIIDFNIIRHPILKNKMMYTIDKGRQAITNYETIEYYENASLVKVQPITGRTHQIRVHFSSIGHALIGDSLYGTPSKFISRQALHAYKLSFFYNENFYSFIYDIPDDMKKLIKNLKSQDL